MNVMSNARLQTIDEFKKAYYTYARTTKSGKYFFKMTNKYDASFTKFVDLHGEDEDLDIKKFFRHTKEAYEFLWPNQLNVLKIWEEYLNAKIDYDMEKTFEEKTTDQMVYFFKAVKVWSNSKNDGEFSVPLFIKDKTKLIKLGSLPFQVLVFSKTFCDWYEEEPDDTFFPQEKFITLRGSIMCYPKLINSLRKILKEDYCDNYQIII